MFTQNDFFDFHLHSLCESEIQGQVLRSQVINTSSTEDVLVQQKGTEKNEKNV